MPPLYPLLGLLAGYVLVMLANPNRLALRDGLRCIVRYERIWLTFVLLGLAYAAFQSTILAPRPLTLQFGPLDAPSSWAWPRLADVAQDAPLPAVEGVAGLFDNATTTYPLSVLAAILLLVNWRGLHRALWKALRKLYRRASIAIYLLVLVSLLAALVKPLVYWQLPLWQRHLSTAHLLQLSAVIDATSFLFEYFVGVYLQVYLITVCVAWIKGASFREGALFAFAMRRFSYVLEWAGVMVAISLLVVRLPMLLAYFIAVPNVLDYLPAQRLLMCAVVVLFCSVQASLALHNETLGEAWRAHRQLMRRDGRRVGWFLLVALLHFYLILVLDAWISGAVADRFFLAISWKVIFVLVRAFVTGWLLASWVVLFRQCETGRVAQEKAVPY
ncbi:MAG: hypothetical protein ABI839_03015 [Verrucomicrobiota bacterium]